MKTKLFLGLSLFIIALCDVVYWFYYWNSNKKVALSDYAKFIQNYRDSLPYFIRPLYYNNLSAIILCLMFLISGIFFWKSNKNLYKILAIIAFMFSFLQLFSLM